METLDYLIKKFSLALDAETAMPIEIPNLGRDNLPEIFRELGFKTGVEIGVYFGEYSEKLCRANPELKLYSIDPWEKIESFSEYENDRLQDAFKSAKQRLRDYNCTLVKKSSMQAIEHFADNSIDFVYIDGNHDAKHVTEDIAEWSKKVKIGGIISGHDYIKFKNPSSHQVVEAIGPYVANNKIRPWFIVGLRKKIPGMIRDHHRSWMWVKTK